MSARSALLVLSLALLCALSAHAEGRGAIAGRVTANSFENVLPDGLQLAPPLEWSEQYSLAEFPAVFSLMRTLTVARGQVLSVHFRTDSGGLSPGSLIYNEADSGARAGYLSISTAPGDFDPQSVGSACVNSEAVGNFGLGFASAAQPLVNRCILQPDTDYRINLHFGVSDQPGADGSYCGNVAGCRVIGGTQQF